MKKEIDAMAESEANEACPCWFGFECECARYLEVGKKTDDIAYGICKISCAIHISISIEQLLLPYEKEIKHEVYAIMDARSQTTGQNES